MPSWYELLGVTSHLHASRATTTKAVEFVGFIASVDFVESDNCAIGWWTDAHCWGWENIEQAPLEAREGSALHDQGHYMRRHTNYEGVHWIERCARKADKSFPS